MREMSGRRAARHSFELGTERRRSLRSNRVFDFPRVRVSAEKHDEAVAAKELAAWVVQCGYEDLFVVASRHGAGLTEALPGVTGAVTPPRRAGRGWAERLGRRVAATGARTIVAVGGGRCLDAAKLAASCAGLPVVAVPTQLSHDGICSPVAVLPDGAGASRSLPAVFPSAVFFSLPTIRNAPERSVRAGLGDLLSNPFAVRDWELAATLGEDEIDDEAWHLALESTELVDPWLSGTHEVDGRDPELLTLLGHALANSGLAMMRAGSSRPASGGEHKVSHALDLMFGGRALHGEQVAFACIVSAALHGMEVGPVMRQVARLGLPTHPRELGLGADELAEVLVAAPGTRPGRFTILEQARLTRAGAGDLVRSIWERC
jgi:glycerol-1-phosphate dehydrogenase [NAD(P)+]